MTCPSALATSGSNEVERRGLSEGLSACLLTAHRFAGWLLCGHGIYAVYFELEIVPVSWPHPDQLGVGLCGQAPANNCWRTRHINVPASPITPAIWNTSMMLRAKLMFCQRTARVRGGSRLAQCPMARSHCPERSQAASFTMRWLRTAFTSAPDAALTQVKQQSRIRIYSEPNRICSVSPALHHVQRSPTSPPMGSPGAALVAVRSCYGRGQRLRPG